MFAVAVLACATEPTAPIAAADASGDASAPSDASVVADSGASTPPDAASADAAVPDGGTTSLSAWFANYNEGLGITYLDIPYATDEAGDARYPATPHRHHRDVRYGPRARNVLELWQVTAAAPAPVAVFIHGGGFNMGSPESVHDDMAVARLLAAGISVATISYRWAYEDPARAVVATNPDDEGSVQDVNGTRVDFILRDCARAIQFLRYRAAEWGIDEAHIGAWGPSAGAGCSTWIGTTDDLAVPNHADPVLRQSTRIAAVGHLVGQPTYDWTRWPELLRLDEAFVRNAVAIEQSRLTWRSFDDLRAATDLRAILDYYQHMGPGDAAFFTQNMLPDANEMMIRSDSQVIHHPRGHVSLYQRCVAMGLDCEIQTRIQSSGFNGDVVDFLIDRLR